MPKPPDLPEFISSHGRTRGRRLRPRQKQLVDELLSDISLNDAVRAEQAVELNKLFPDKRAIHLEIGYGGGEHLAARALTQPENGFIGCEPFMNGTAKLLSRIDEQRLENIRLFTGDVRYLLPLLPEASIGDVYLLFPDPWPRQRHHKRRIVNGDTLAMLARIHSADGRLLIATDHVDYCGWIVEKILASNCYEWTARQMADWKQPPADWVETRYQQKALQQGRKATFIECRRI